VQQKSVFVDIVGWVFAVLAGFGVLIGILQNVMVHVMFPPDFREQIAQNATHVGAGFEMFRYLEIIAAVVLVLMAITLISAVGLLKRRNWARTTFIGLMLLGVAWNAVSFAWQLYFMNELMPHAVQAKDEFAERFNAMFSVMTWATGAIALALSALFGWIAWKLTRPVIRAEFNGREAGAGLSGQG